MSAHIQRTCVFKRCPDTAYVPRKSIATPTSIYALDLNDWADVAALKHDILSRMSYLECGVQAINYHLLGESCSMQRPLEALFNDPVQHAPQRRSKGVMLHLETESKQVVAKNQEKVVDINERLPEKVNNELTFNEGENYDPKKNTWGRVIPYAWDSGSLASRFELPTSMFVAELPERFGHEILQCASRDECFTTHYLRYHQSNVMFTSAIAINGKLFSLEDRTANEQIVSDLVSDRENVIHAAVIMTKTKINAPSPDMILEAVRPISTES